MKYNNRGICHFRDKLYLIEQRVPQIGEKFFYLKDPSNLFTCFNIQNIRTHYLIKANLSYGYSRTIKCYKHLDEQKYYTVIERLTNVDTYITTFKLNY